MLAGCLMWALLIFLTSCTVIRPQEFFDWIHTNLLIDDNVFQQFQALWAVLWFVVVKGWHALEFAILFLLCLATLDRFYPSGTQVERIGWAIAVSSLFAVTDEWHQTFVPDRGGAVSDVLVDTLGILLAAWFVIRRRLTQRSVVLTGESSQPLVVLSAIDRSGRN